MDLKESSWLIPVDKLMFWRAGNWIKYENKTYNLFLRLHCDQLLITNNNKVLETLNMNGKIKGIYKDDVLIIIVCTNVQEHLKRLGEHFLVVNHNDPSKNDSMRYRKVGDIFKNVIENYSENAASHLPFDFNNFIRLCLLDPFFPQVVHEAQKIIECELLSKK